METYIVQLAKGIRMFGKGMLWNHSDFFLLLHSFENLPLK
jgi:hypothetical protein